MPKNLFKRLLPSSDYFKKDRYLKRALGTWLNQPYLWALNRSSVSRAMFIGLFCCFLPTPGQMVIAAFFAVYFSANLALSVSLVWISNPITMVPMMYSAYAVGCYLLGIDMVPLHSKSDWNFMLKNINEYLMPVTLGCIVNGLITAVLGYFSIQLFWRWSVSRTWRARQLSREQRKST